MNLSSDFVQKSAQERSAPTKIISSERRHALIKLLIGKAFLETLFVLALGVWFSYSLFNPRIRGRIDIADKHTVAGWTLDENAPSEQLEVQLFINDRYVAHTIADRARPDIVHAGRATNEAHGFEFTLPVALNAGEYEASVYVVNKSSTVARRGLMLVGVPVRFRVNE